MKKKSENSLMLVPPLALKYLDPKFNIVFKRLFGTHKHLTIDFLNAMLPLDSPIVELEFIPEEMKPGLPGYQFSNVYVRCCDANGRHFLVEMQNRWERRFLERIFFSSSRAYVNQKERGQDYDALRQVYMLAFSDRVVFPDEPDVWYHHFYPMRNGRRHEELQFMEAVVIELPKHPEDATETPRDLWIRFLSETDETVRAAREELKAYAPIREALDRCEEAAFDDADRGRYFKELDEQRIARGLERSEQERLAKMEKAEADLKQKALKLLDEGVSLEELAARLKQEPAEVKAWLGLED